MRWALPWLVVACSYSPPAAIGDAPAGDGHDDGPSDGSPVVPCANPISDQLFTSPTACTPWGNGFTSGSATITQGNGELVFDLVSLTSNGAGCISPSAIPMPAGGVVVEVPEVVNGGGTFTQLQILKADSVSLGVNGSELRYAQNSGLPIYHSGTYNAAAMRWWRLRPSAGTIIAEHSADGLAWVDFGSHATAIDNMKVQLIVGSGGGQNTGVSRFTRLVLCP